MFDAIEADLDLKICQACACQYGPDGAPEVCPICLDDRHAVPPGGQVYTSIRKAQAAGYTIKFQTDTTDPDITFIVTVPTFAIGQSPMLVKTASGYMMLECCGFITAEAVTHILQLCKESDLPFLGIAISHPHWYNSSTTWARALGCKIYTHALDKEWWLRSDSVNEVEWFSGNTFKIGEHATMILCGGHFTGSCVTYIERPGKAGLLGAGDTIMVAHNARQVSFMYSYTNWVPLQPKEVIRIWNAVLPYKWSDAYGPWPHRHIVGNAREIILDGVKKFIQAEGWSAKDFALEE